MGTIKIEKGTFKDAMSVLKQAVATSKTLTLDFSLLQITPTKKGITLRTTTGDTGMELTVKGVADSVKDVFYFPFESALKICSSPATKGNITFDVSKNEILIKYSTARYKFSKINTESLGYGFKTFDKFIAGKKEKIEDVQAFDKSIKFASVMQSDNVAKPEVCGVGVLQIDGKAALTSTNYLAIATSPVKTSMKNMWIPSLAVKILTSSEYMVKQVTFGKESSSYSHMFNLEGPFKTKLYVKAQVVSQPNIGKWLKKMEAPNKFDVKVVPLANAVKRAEAIFAMSTSSAIAHLLAFTYKEGTKLTLNAVNNKNVFKDTIEVLPKGKAKEFSYCGLLEQVQNALEGASKMKVDTVSLEFSSSGNLMIISVKDNKYYLLGQAE